MKTSKTTQSGQHGLKPIDLVHSLEEYIKQYPEQRFWQAVRNWSEYNYIFIGNDREDLKDSFYLKGK